MPLKSYSGPDEELEELLKQFDRPRENKVIPVELVAVSAELLGETYPQILKTLLKKAEERANMLGICKEAYVTNITFDEETKTMTGDIFKQRCNSSADWTARSLKTYSRSAERLNQLLQRKIEPVEIVTAEVEKGGNYVKALENLAKTARERVKTLGLKEAYLANIHYDSKKLYIKADMLESTGYSTACDLIT